MRHTWFVFSEIFFISERNKKNDERTEKHYCHAVFITSIKRPRNNFEHRYFYHGRLILPAGPYTRENFTSKSVGDTAIFYLKKEMEKKKKLIRLCCGNVKEECVRIAPGEKIGKEKSENKSANYYLARALARRDTLVFFG